jgi:hypothetical protein
VLTILFAPVGFVFFIVGLVYYAYIKAKIRTTLREQLNIPGTLMSDFTVHLCCPCCAVAQEAREAKAKNVKELDFVYGEELSTLAFPQVERGGYTATHNSPLTTPAVEEGNEVGLIDRLKSVSMLSNTILRVWLAVVVATFIALLATGRGLSIVVLMLVFVQPFLILYFVYWRDPEKNKHVSLDYVIKLFAVGFFLSTSQSIVFESILEGILQMVASLVLLILNPHMNDSNDDGDKANQVLQFVHALRPHFAKPGSWSTLLSAAFTNTYTFLASTEGAWQPHDANYGQAYSAIPAPDGHTYLPLATAVPALASSNGTDSDSDDGMTPELMRKNFFIIILAMFVMAFVIAAGVEETMKHFAVRCCRFPAPLKDPKSALIYLMTAALGFATSENIEYVFGATK